MKPSLIAFAILCASLIGMTGQTFAELASLRGEVAVPSTVAAPAVPEFMNDKENIARTFAEQPPLVPHEVDKYTINLNENKCLECHMKQPGKDKAKSVEMSAAHFTDRNGNKLDQPSGSRHFCNQCHVPQVDAMPLIGSNFESIPRKSTP